MPIYFPFLLLFLRTVADPQSLFEEKESLEEKVAVREYELRLAQEDILNLKAELLKKTEMNLDEPRGIYPIGGYCLSKYILNCYKCYTDVVMRTWK